MKKHLVIFYAVFYFVLTGCANKHDEDSLSIMTLNLRYDNPQDSINAWPYRSSMVCKFMAAEQPDIVGMQEVLVHQYELLDSVLADYESVGIGRSDGSKGGEMNPVFFRKDRFDMVRTITFWLSDTIDKPGTLGWGASLPRIVTWMELVDKNNHQHFFFFNTHFAHDSDSARIMSSKILLEKVYQIADGFPFIITGDFNMLPASLGYSILTGNDESVPLINDSYIISEKKPSGPAYTFNGFSDRPGAGRIDYIFVKRGITVKNHRTIIKKERNIFLSDHWPVMATVLLKEE